MGSITPNAKGAHSLSSSASISERIVLVVPCYNEARRFRPDAFSAALTRFKGLSFVFVDDGSTDETFETLVQFQSGAPGARVDIVRNAQNRGKAESVRRGLQHAAKTHPTTIIGYWDADLATPLDDLDLFLIALAKRPKAQAFLGTRLPLSGHRVFRGRLRALISKAFLTLANFLLGLSVHDTQCGAKLFRPSAALTRALEAPFRSRWLFDVELLTRLKQNVAGLSSEQLFYECPLDQWTEVGGSKIKRREFAFAIFDLLQITARSWVSAWGTRGLGHETGPEVSSAT